MDLLKTVQVQDPSCVTGIEFIVLIKTTGQSGSPDPGPSPSYHSASGHSRSSAVSQVKAATPLRILSLFIQTSQNRLCSALYLVSIPELHGLQKLLTLKYGMDFTGTYVFIRDVPDRVLFFFYFTLLNKIWFNSGRKI